MHTLLLTGFEPWGDHTRNASWEAVCAAAPTVPDGWRIRRLRLPVRWDDAWARLAAAIGDDVRGVLACGQAATARLLLEQRAVNQAAGMDVDGREPAPRLDPAGPEERFSRAPHPRLLAAMQREGLAAALSADGGRFLCNALFYQLLGFVDHRRADLVVSFLHVPEAALADVERARAVEVVAGELLAHLQLRQDAFARLWRG